MLGKIPAMGYDLIFQQLRKRKKGKYTPNTSDSEATVCKYSTK